MAKKLFIKKCIQMSSILFIFMAQSYAQDTNQTVTNWPPEQASAVASVEYYDDNMLYHKIFVYWNHTHYTPRDIFTIKDTNGVTMQRIVFDSLVTKHELQTPSTYRLLALHHFRESLVGSILQLEDLRLMTVNNFGVKHLDSLFENSSSYTKVTSASDTLYLYSHKKKLTKSIVFDDYITFQGHSLPQKITVRDVKNKAKRATIRIENIGINDQDALLKMLSQN